MSLNSLLCSTIHNYRLRKRKPYGEEKSLKLHKRLNKIIDDFTIHGKWKNIHDLGYNNMATFTDLWHKHTGFEFEPAEIPIRFKDVRKFETGIEFFNRMLARDPSGLEYIFMLPKALMRNVPELEKISKDLTDETGFYKNFTQTNNGHANDFLKNMLKLANDIGDKKIQTVGKISGRKAISYDGLRKVIDHNIKLLDAPNISNKKRTEAGKKYNAAMKEMRKFLTEGAGETYLLMNQMILGADIETLRTKPTPKNPDGMPLTSSQKKTLREMNKSDLKSHAVK